MKLDFSNTQIFIRPRATDLRKAITGLSYMVRDEMNLKVLDGSGFLFCNKSRKVQKLLLWDKTGFWLVQKRLERNMAMAGYSGRGTGNIRGKHPSSPERN